MDATQSGPPVIENNELLVVRLKEILENCNDLATEFNNLVNKFNKVSYGVVNALELARRLDGGKA
jgi:hypothetical protein